MKREISDALEMDMEADADFKNRIAEMDANELRSRILNQRSTIASYQKCLDGMGFTPNDDSHRRPDDIRVLVKNLQYDLESKRVDSNQLERMAKRIIEATPDFKSIMGSECDHAEVALGELIRRALNK